MFSLITCFLGLIVVVVCGHDLALFLKTRRWQKGVGRISEVRKTIVPHPSNHMVAPHQKRRLTFFECDYCYEAGGRSHSGTAVIPLDGFNINAQVVAGSPIPIRIDARDPAKSMLDPPFPHGIWLAAALVAGSIVSLIRG